MLQTRLMLLQPKGDVVILIKFSWMSSALFVLLAGFTFSCGSPSPELVFPFVFILLVYSCDLMRLLTEFCRSEPTENIDVSVL